MCENGFYIEMQAKRKKKKKVLKGDLISIYFSNSNFFLHMLPSQLIINFPIQVDVSLKSNLLSVMTTKSFEKKLLSASGNQHIFSSTTNSMKFPSIDYSGCGPRQ